MNIKQQRRRALNRNNKCVYIVALVFIILTLRVQASENCTMHFSEKHIDLGQVVVSQEKKEIDAIVSPRIVQLSINCIEATDFVVMLRADSEGVNYIVPHLGVINVSLSDLYVDKKNAQVVFTDGSEGGVNEELNFMPNKSLTVVRNGKIIKGVSLNANITYSLFATQALQVRLGKKLTFNGQFELLD